MRNPLSTPVYAQVPQAPGRTPQGPQCPGAETVPSGGHPRAPDRPPEASEAPAREADERACHDDVCITCSDTAVEVTVLRLLDDELAIVATGQGEEEVSVALVTVQAGDRILVHAREAIAVVGR